MPTLDITSITGPDGTPQQIVDDNLLVGMGGDDFRTIETRVGNVIFRTIRHGVNVVSLAMLDRYGRRVGGWESVRIWMTGSLSELDESSEWAIYAIAPQQRWLCQDRRITHGLRIGTIYDLGNRHLTLAHFDGLRLDEYLVRLYLKSINKERIEHFLYNRVINFERWLPRDGLRVNISLTLGEGQNRQEFAAYFEIDLKRRKVRRMIDISKVRGYNYQPNVH